MERHAVAGIALKDRPHTACRALEDALILADINAACEDLHLAHYWSRPRTPKDNAVNKRFNRTIQDEFLALGTMTADTVAFNRRLTEWLVGYNFGRPHQALNYMPPISFTFKYHKVLPMYPSSTRA